jgi:hypothetical protein
MPGKMTPSFAIKNYLSGVKQAVAKLGSPLLNTPVEIPDFEILYGAANQLDGTSYPADMMLMIHAGLSRASDYGNNIPRELNLPDDHHLQTTMGTEWYWIGCTLQVKDENNNLGQLGVLVSMQKIRTMSIEAQQQAGWSDYETMILSTTSTVTVNMNDQKQIFRRSPNKQWGYFSKEIAYSVPGEDFWIGCGPDFIRGSMDVMPLQVSINDLNNFTVDLVLSPPANISAQNAYFLQGVPDPNWHGTGVTAVPTPGIYYSFPQLQVQGTVNVGGINYTVIPDGSFAWVDHQMMMASLENGGEPPAKEPVPFLQDAGPINGWTWQYFNLNNGDAFTGSSFIQGNMDDAPVFPYGYYVQQQNNAWVGTFMMGFNEFSNFAPFKAPVCNHEVLHSILNIPLTRTYEIFAMNGSKFVLGSASAWIPDGTFNNPNWATASENPSDYISTDKTITGKGFLETVSLEPTANYHDRLVNFLKNGNFPCME